MKSFGKILIVVFVIAIGAGAIYLVASNGGKEVAAPEVQPNAEAMTASQDQTVEKSVPEGPHPRIQFEELVHDWGEVYQDEKIIHVFKFKNVGDVDLTVDKVKSG